MALFIYLRSCKEDATEGLSCGSWSAIEGWLIQANRSQHVATYHQRYHSAGYPSSGYHGTPRTGYRQLGGHYLPAGSRPSDRRLDRYRFPLGVYGGEHQRTSIRTAASAHHRRFCGDWPNTSLQALSCTDKQHSHASYRLSN